MSKHSSLMRLNKHLVSSAQAIAKTLNRSSAQQIEFWAELAKTVNKDKNLAKDLLK